MCPWFLQNYFAILHILSNLNLFAAAFPSIYPFCFLKMYLKQVYTCQNDFTFSQDFFSLLIKTMRVTYSLTKKALCASISQFATARKKYIIMKKHFA